MDCFVLLVLVHFQLQWLAFYHSTKKRTTKIRLQDVRQWDHTQINCIRVKHCNVINNEAKKSILCCIRTVLNDVFILCCFYRTFSSASLLVSRHNSCVHACVCVFELRMKAMSNRFLVIVSFFVVCCTNQAAHLFHLSRYFLLVLLTPKGKFRKK